MITLTQPYIKTKSLMHLPILKWILVFTIVNLHTLRNLNFPLFLALYFPILCIALLDFVKFGYKNLSKRGVIIFIWIGVIAFGIFTTTIFSSPSASFNGFFRYIYAFPLLLACVNYIKSKSDFRLALGFVGVFFALASITLPLQFVTGPIPWFPESSERAGLVRYSSIIGSLTSIGTIVGSYIILTEINKKAQYIIITVLISCAVLSLSKAAIANVAIGMVIVLMINIKAFHKIVPAVLLVIGIFAYSYNNLGQFSDRINATLSSFGINAGNRDIVNYDVSFEKSLLDRVTSLPLDNYKHLADLNTPVVYIVGGGYGMASTALVQEQDSLAIMAHNQYAENITVFGWILGIIMSSILFYINGWLIFKYFKEREKIYLIVFLSYTCLLANAIFANGMTYQPASATIMYIAMFLVAIGGFHEADRR